MGNPTSWAVEALLKNQAWIRQLARRLVQEEAAADEVVQQVWLSALKTARREVRNPRAWLTIVTRNTAKKLELREKRLRRREREVSKDETVSAEAPSIEREDTRRALVAEVQELKEPYRSTLLLHFYEGLSTKEIARRNDQSWATVRIHLKRGLDQLRKQLRTRYGDRRDWGLLLLPLAVEARESGPDEAQAASPHREPKVWKTHWAAAGLLVLALPIAVLSIPSDDEKEARPRTAALSPTLLPPSQGVDPDAGSREEEASRPADPAEEEGALAEEPLRSPRESEEADADAPAEPPSGSEKADVFNKETGKPYPGKKKFKTGPLRKRNHNNPAKLSTGSEYGKN